MQLRYKRSERTLRRGRHEPERGTALRAPEPRHRSEQPAHEPLSGDEALYTCTCGFVFVATVSTGVGCPHCGDTQAW